MPNWAWCLCAPLHLSECAHIRFLFSWVFVQLQNLPWFWTLHWCGTWWPRLCSSKPAGRQMGPALSDSSQNSPGSSSQEAPECVGGCYTAILFWFSAVQGWRTWKWMLAEAKPSHKTLAPCLEKWSHIVKSKSVVEFDDVGLKGPRTMAEVGFKNKNIRCWLVEDCWDTSGVFWAVAFNLYLDICLPSFVSKQ